MFATMDSSESNTNVLKEKVRKKGIIYLSTIPPNMNVTQIIEIMSQYGKVGRVFLQPVTAESGKAAKRKRRGGIHFTEGWVEFLRKRVAKEVAGLLNNTQISSQKKSRHFDYMWNIKYLPCFKWVHLTERLEYERAVYKQRMRTEIAQAKREATHFVESVELSEKIKRKLKKQTVDSDSGPLLQYRQRKTDDEIRNVNSENKTDDRTDFLRGLFGDTSQKSSVN